MQGSLRRLARQGHGCVMKLPLFIETEKPETVEPARWPSSNLVAQIAALLRGAGRPPDANCQPANNASNLNIRIASNGRGEVLSRKI